MAVTNPGLIFKGLSKILRFSASCDMAKSTMHTLLQATFDQEKSKFDV